MFELYIGVNLKIAYDIVEANNLMVYLLVLASKGESKRSPIAMAVFIAVAIATPRFTVV